MGIKFICPKCGRHLNVKASLGGKRGRCPHCNDKIFIPAADETSGGAGVGGDTPLPGSVPTTSVAATPAMPAPITPATSAAGGGVAPGGATDPISEAPSAQWYVTPASGGSQYGPATGEVLRGWMQEGRVAADSLVWRQDWPEWKKASLVFPQLGPSSSTAPTGMALPGGYPTAGIATGIVAPGVIPTAVPAGGIMGPAGGIMGPAGGIMGTAAIPGGMAPIAAVAPLAGMPAGGAVPMATVAAAGPMGGPAAAWPAAPGPTLGPRVDRTRYRRRSNTGPIIAIVVLLLAMIPLSYLVWQVLNNQLTTVPMTEPGDETEPADETNSEE